MRQFRCRSNQMPAMFDMNRKFFSRVFSSWLLLRYFFWDKLSTLELSLLFIPLPDMTITMYRSQGKRAADALKSKNETIIKEKSLILAIFGMSKIKRELVS